MVDHWIINGYEYFMPTASFVMEYDVGREGIGVVSQEFTVGQAIPAKLVDGELMFLAVYTVGQKHYSTNIFLDPTLFTQTTQNGVEITSLKDYSEPEQLMIAGIAIFLALIIKYD